MTEIEIHTHELTLLIRKKHLLIVLSKEIFISINHYQLTPVYIFFVDGMKEVKQGKIILRNLKTVWPSSK